MATYKPLSTDFKDDILASQNSKRKYTQVNNPDGTVSFQDSTAYSQVGSSYGAKEVNEEREAINNIYANKLVTLDEIDLVTEPGFFVDAQVVKELNSKMIPVFVSNPFQFAGTGNKTFKYTVSGNGYAFISLSGHIGCEAGNDYGQLEVKIWDKNHILLTMDRCVEATTFNYDFGAACSTVIPVQDGDVITGTLLASKNGKKTILANACCFGCQISITHD